LIAPGSGSTYAVAPNTPSGGTPGPLFGAVMAYDPSPSVQAVILYGGARTSGYISGATWSFVGGTWTNDSPYFSSPAPRWGAAMAYDPADGFLVMYGGCAVPPSNGYCTFAYSETWSLGATGWGPLDLPSWFIPGAGPGPLYDVALTFDVADNYLMLFGGAEGWQNVPPPMPPQLPPLPAVIPRASSWIFSAGAWTNSTCSGMPGFCPMARYGANLAYSPQLKAVILFGGTNRTLFSTGVVYGDTWTYSAGTWSRFTTGFSPPPRWDALLVYDSFSKGLLLIGGAMAPGTPGNDMWELASNVTGWVELRPLTPPVGGFPDPRFASTITYDGFDGYVLLFGGMSPSGSAFSDDWMDNRGTWTELSIGVPFAGNPSSRWAESLTYLQGQVVGTGEIVMFGGQQCLPNRCLVLGDTWLYVGGEWERLAPRVSPTPRFGAAMAAAPGGYVLLFGGCGIVCPLGDTWKFQNNRWTEFHLGTGPSARYFASLLYDLSDNAFVLFGGCLGGHQLCPAGDTWLFVNNEWINITGSTGSTPPARFGAGADTSSGYAVMFGGMGTGGALNDMWWFVNFAWQLLPTGPVAPPPMDFPTFAYDPIDGGYLLWGGCSYSNCPNGLTLFYPFNGSLTIPATGWVPWTPVGPWFPPPPMYGAAATFDPLDGALGYVLFFGGRSSLGSSTEFTDQYIGGAWNILNPWT
jgi:hypothetical protein